MCVWQCICLKTDDYEKKISVILLIFVILLNLAHSERLRNTFDVVIQFRVLSLSLSKRKLNDLVRFEQRIQYQGFYKKIFLSSLLYPHSLYWFLLWVFFYHWPPLFEFSSLAVVSILHSSSDTIIFVWQFPSLSHIH